MNDNILEDLLNEQNEESLYASTNNTDPQATSVILTKYSSDLKKVQEKLSQLKGLEKQITLDSEVIKLVEAYKKYTGFDTKIVRSHLQYIELDSRGLEDKEVYSFRELMDLATDGSTYIVPRLFRSAGLYMIYADPKVGKTTFIYDFIYGVTISGSFLEYPCKKSKVIFYQLEEPLVNIQLVMAKKGFFDDEDSTSLLRKTNLFEIRRSLSIQDDKEKLSKMIVEEKPTILIIDSLRKATYTSAISENTAEFTQLVYSIQDIAIKHNILVIVIHHANKQGKLAGNNGIAGATDGVFNMTAIKEDGEKKVLLESNPRHGMPLSLVLSKKVDEGDRWRIVIERDNNVLPEVKELEDRIIRFLSKIPDHKYLKGDIAKDLGVDLNNGYFNSALINLQESEIILSTYSKIDNKATFYYHLPSTSPWLDRNTIISQFLTKDVTMADALSKCRTRKEVRELSKNWPKDLSKKDVYKLLDAEERNRFMDLIKTSPYKEGDNVSYENKSYIVNQCRQISKDSNIFECYIEELDKWIHEDKLEMMVEDDKVTTEKVVIDKEDEDDF